MVGLVLYISSINDEVMNRPSGSEQYFQYRYGWSFAFAASSFLLKEVRPLHALHTPCTPCTPLARLAHSIHTRAELPHSHPNPLHAL